jgi:alanine dehydrogenase
MSRDTLILTERDARKLVSIREAIPLVEEAFKLKALGKVRMPPKIYVEIPEYSGDLRVMPCYIHDKGILAAKIVTVYPLNPSTRNLHTVLATIIVLDREDGKPLAIIDGTWITLVRTSAAGAVAVKWLAPADARILAVIGAGRQGYGQVEAILQVSKHIEEIRVYDIRAEASQALASKFKEYVAVAKPVETAREAVEDADIIVTATPSRKPIIYRLWVKNGVHFNCIGADRHWPFIEEYNRIGIIEPTKLLSALEDGGAGQVYLFLEVIHPFEYPDDKVLEELRESSRYWREYVERIWCYGEYTRLRCIINRGW